MKGRPKLKIVFKHHFETRNLGDRVCSPFDFYGDLAEGGQRVDLNQPTPRCDAVVYGGGKIMGGLAKTLGPEDRRARARIAWGVSTVQKSRIAPHYWKAYRRMTLVGSRDWGDKRFDWAPCVTCLADAFTEPQQEQHEVVAYLHHWRRRDSGIEIPAGVPRDGKHRS